MVQALMKVDIATVLDCPIEKAWVVLQTRALWERIAWPLARIAPVKDAHLPERWQADMTLRCRLFVFGFVPLGVHTIRIETVDPATFAVQSREYDRLVRRWDHLITLTPEGSGRTRYRDVIEMDAGVMTPAVWAWAQWFYRHRQRRWRRVAKELAACRSPAHAFAPSTSCDPFPFAGKLN